ncbi:MAG: serine/threonine-protein kinase, partial [Pseudomonadota bacterium]
MSDQDQKLTEILDLLHGVPEHEEEETLRELRRSDRPLHERVVAELELMRVARAAIPTPSGNPTVDVDSRHARAGSSFAGYTIESCIGVGGMGSVYRAIRRTPFQQSVAIKVLHPLLATEAFRRRFEIEQRALASLDHPAIASILDAGEFDGSPYLIMELVDGVPIDQFCQESGASLNDKIRMTELIANAMQHAHDRGVIHRDIKPSNLLVRTVDGVPAVTVIDFGIARLLGEDTNSSDRPTVPMGTPVFASPEQSDSSAASATVRSDIYSLGATLRYLLEPPGDGSWSASRQDVKAVVAKATSQHPNDRYSSAAEFAGDLRRLQDRVPVRARPIGVVTRSLRWAQRHPAGSSLGLAVVVLIIAASLAALRSQVTETQRQAATEAFEETQGYYLGTLLGLAHSRELGTNTRIRELIDSLTRERQSAFTDISDSGLRASARAEMLLGLATLWIDLEDSELALLLLAESEDAARRGGVFHGDLQIDTLMRRIDAARRQQDIGLAITSGEEAVRLATLEHGADSRRVSQIGTYLGLALVDAQDWDRAREVLEQSLAIDQRRLGADHIETIRSRGNLAFLSMRQGDPVAAATMYANLIDLLERTGRSSSVDMYLFQRQLGSLYVVLERFEEAEPLLRDAIAGMTKLNGVAHAEVIRPSIRLADAIAGLGRADEALPLYDAAVDAAEDGRLNWLAGAEAVRSKAQTLTQLGRQVEAIETRDRKRMLPCGPVCLRQLPGQPDQCRVLVAKSPPHMDRAAIQSFDRFNLPPELSKRLCLASHR